MVRAIAKNIYCEFQRYFRSIVALLFSFIFVMELMKIQIHISSAGQSTRSNVTSTMTLWYMHTVHVRHQKNNEQTLAASPDKNNTSNS